MGDFWTGQVIKDSVATKSYDQNSKACSAWYLLRSTRVYLHGLYILSVLFLDIRLAITVRDDQIHGCRYWQANITFNLSAANISSV